MSTSNRPPVTIFPVLLVNFIGMLGYSIIIPFLVFMVEKFGGNEFIYGLLGSVYPAFQLIGAPLLGRWSDSVGRRRILLLSQTGTFLAWALFILSLLMPKTSLFVFDSELTGAFLFTLPLLLLFFARALDGLTGGNVSVANAYLADISTDQNRKANFGKMASSTSLGFILGPALAGLLGATVYEELPPVIAAALISLTAIFVIQRFLPESRPSLVDPNLKLLDIRKMFQIEHKECYEMKNCPDTGLRAVLRLPHIPLLFGVYFFTFLGFSFFYAGFPVFASRYMEWDAFQLGMYFTVSSVIMVCFQGPVLNFLSSRVPDAALVLVGSALIAANFFFLPVGEPWAVYTANILMASGNGLMWPSFLSILSKTGTENIQGTIQGYANSAGSLASIFGLVLGGLLFTQAGPVVFIISGVLFLIIFVLSFRLIGAEKQLAAVEVVS